MTHNWSCLNNWFLESNLLKMLLLFRESFQDRLEVTIPQHQALRMFPRDGVAVALGDAQQAQLTTVTAARENLHLLEIWAVAEDHRPRRDQIHVETHLTWQENNFGAPKAQSKTVQKTTKKWAQQKMVGCSFWPKDPPSLKR